MIKAHGPDSGEGQRRARLFITVALVASAMEPMTNFFGGNTSGGDM